MTTWHSPAKINLYLAVTGSRDDGFHEIDSLVALLDFGDTLRVGLSQSDRDEYSCNVPGLSFDSGNLVYRALALYRDKTGFSQPVSIDLEKRIPMGAGLGGGSSNASTLLKAVNALNPDPVSTERLAEWSADLGSDCPLFFGSGLLRIRGRGERVEPFPCRFLEGGRKLKLAIFHPGFPIEAAWAYKTLRSRFPSHYTDPCIVQEELARWAEGSDPWIGSHRNDLSIPVDSKYVAIPILKKEFVERFKPLFMSGSGSACFCVLEPDDDELAITEFVRSCWGNAVFICISLIL